MSRPQRPVIFERIMLRQIKDEGGTVLVTKRHDIEGEPARIIYTTESGSFLRYDIVGDLIHHGFLEPADGGLFGDDPTTYKIAGDPLAIVAA